MDRHVGRSKTKVVHVYVCETCFSHIFTISIVPCKKAFLNKLLSQVLNNESNQFSHMIIIANRSQPGQLVNQFSFIIVVYGHDISIWRTCVQHVVTYHLVQTERDGMNWQIFGRIETVLYVHSTSSVSQRVRNTHGAPVKMGKWKWSTHHRKQKEMEWKAFVRNNSKKHTQKHHGKVATAFIWIFRLLCFASIGVCVYAFAHKREFSSVVHAFPSYFRIYAFRNHRKLPIVFSFRLPFIPFLSSVWICSLFHRQ